MKRIMLDLETLDVGPDALILSLGACEFEPGVPLVKGRTFYTAVVHQNQQARWGRTVSESTKKWWSEQSEAARFVFNDPAALELDRALLNFTYWLEGHPVEMWANGADFDCVILGRAYAATSLARPWSYSHNRCFRTLKNLGIPLAAGEGIVRQGTHHNALDDALYQAHYAAAWLGKLEKAKWQ